MRKATIGIATIAILAGAGLPSVFSAPPPPPTQYRILYSFKGGADGALPVSDLTLDAAGNLYGTTKFGGTGCGNSGCGTVFELERHGSGWQKRTLHMFGPSGNDISPAAGLVFDSAGNLYGATLGTVFELSPNSRGIWTEHIIYSFPEDGSAGFVPTADLVFDADGNLYGTASEGGPFSQNCFSGCGTVFKLTHHPDGSWTETTIHGFQGDTNGGWVSSGVALDAAGNVFGMTSSGGIGKCMRDTGNPGCGLIYEFSPDSKGGWTETVIYDFNRGGGFAVNPSGGLVLLDPTHLLATSIAGGDGEGAVIELTKSSKGWKQTVIHRFYGSPDGFSPVGRLIRSASGSLFGVTQYGGLAGRGDGIAYEITPSGKSSGQERFLHRFQKKQGDGDIPQAGLVFDSQGYLYGTTQQGGPYDGGTVYEIVP